MDSTTGSTMGSTMGSKGMPNQTSVSALGELIKAARGEIPADLVLKKGRVVNVFSGRIHENDVAVHQGRIAGLGPRYQGKREVDIHGKWVVPGLVDSHIHIESSMLIPSRLAEALLPLGTTTIVADPHEIANVLGAEGVRFMMEESRGIPFDIFFMAPSCVPATRMETAGAEMDASALSLLRNEKRILGLAEMMNYPGVLARDPDVLEKLILYQGMVRDGHAPSLGGYDLQAYVAAGIGSDHESTGKEEGREKLDAGMMLMIREGTSAKNLEALLPLALEGGARRCCFVSDDLHPQDILRRGHLNYPLGRAMALGLDPVSAVQMVSLNPAEYMGLRDRGAVAPGYRADLVVLKDLEAFSVDQVYKDGQLAVHEGTLIPFQREGQREGRPPEPSTLLTIGLDTGLNTGLNVGPLGPGSFRLKHEKGKARIIELVPGQILTREGREEVREKDGVVVPDTERDILKLAVIERHKGTGNIGLGLVHGFGLKRGAIASSVAHDSHNLIVLGTSDRDMHRAAEALRDSGGGMVAVESEKVLAMVPLPVAGLMSLEPLGALVNAIDSLEKAVASLGCSCPEPFMSLSFLALPVIPEIRLTDRGLIDVNAFAIVSLFDREG